MNRSTKLSRPSSFHHFGLLLDPRLQRLFLLFGSVPMSISSSRSLLGGSASFFQALLLCQSFSAQSSSLFHIPAMALNTDSWQCAGTATSTFKDRYLYGKVYGKVNAPWARVLSVRQLILRMVVEVRWGALWFEAMKNTTRSNAAVSFLYVVFTRVLKGG